ncbi:MAG: CoB--CoM heterodisulfide reductase iron-sulfur subunit A family protein [Deltaproteobacteria bacterium]|nr:CoB--CoM heterodisulfide reductase iron-sulfur subunit A family protein [Deltaproteobacteria bacterium]
MSQPIGAVLVAGGGIAGIQAALDLANSGYKVFLVEQQAAIGGVMAMLDKTFPTNDCAMCIMSPKLVEVGRHANIDILTLTDIESIDGVKGDFKVNLRRRPRYVDLEKCIACGLCAAKCPKKVDDRFNQGLIQRKAAYVLYPQAVPLKYALDAEQCIFLRKGKCGVCAKVCPAGAIRLHEREIRQTLRVGAVILSPGYRAYNPAGLDYFSYGAHPDVMTSLEFERILSASGPYGGHLMRPSDRRAPKRIAWLQCVGSRDQNHCGNFYCSAVCCMYAIKQAVIAKEHSEHPLECTIFYMDMRTHGKGFEDCFNEARDKHGVRFMRHRVQAVRPEKESGRLALRHLGESGKVQTEHFDIVILSVGLETSPELRQWGQGLGVELSPGGFARIDDFNPTATSRDGIYVCGAFAGPKDIPQSVIEAGSAALCAGADLVAGRHTLTVRAATPSERDTRGEPPRVGVFICHCGINIGGVVDVPGVRDYAGTLPNVVYVADNMYSCSQDTQNTISAKIEEHRLNRIVVAACSPKTHEPLFQETLAAAGLNKYLLEFVNIRNQDSWVHMNEPERATAKAKDLVRMAVAKVLRLSPLSEELLTIAPAAMVVGGGVSGMAAALALSRQGYPAEIVERDSALGGQARHLHQTAKGDAIEARLGQLIAQVQADPRIRVHLNARLTKVEGFVGNFKSTVAVGATETVIDHGVAVIASGAQESLPSEYLFGRDERVITGLELDQRMKRGDRRLARLRTAVFIQCVGSREPERPYCSRVCCAHSIVAALHLKELNPEMAVFVLYREIRTYGEREALYRRAREKGVIFIRYERERKPRVSATPEALEIGVVDHALRRPLTIPADLLILASAIVPYRDEQLAQFFKVPMNADGFFVEAHVKLNPCAFATDGVFLCGLAHYPKPIDESIAQAQAAASAATVLLAQRTIRTSGTTARVDLRVCSGCGVCVSLCPYKAPSLKTQGPLAGKAEINPVLCKGCGLCVASCRSGALQLQGFDDGQIMGMIEAA